jgi:hypothetical protein
MVEVAFPLTLLQEIDALVATGSYHDRDEAVAELCRLGLDMLKARAPRPPLPPRPPVPPGHREPGNDEPISVDPRDVNWASDRR